MWKTTSKYGKIIFNAFLKIYLRIFIFLFFILKSTCYLRLFDAFNSYDFSFTAIKIILLVLIINDKFLNYCRLIYIFISAPDLFFIYLTYIIYTCIPNNENYLRTN